MPWPGTRLLRQRLYHLLKSSDQITQPRRSTLSLDHVVCMVRSPERTAPGKSQVMGLCRPAVQVLGARTHPHDKE